MKMSKESFNKIVSTFRTNMEEINRGLEYAATKAKDPEIMTGWASLRFYMPKGFIIDVLYGQEKLNDKHIETAIKKAFKQIKEETK